MQEYIFKIQANKNSTIYNLYLWSKDIGLIIIILVTSYYIAKLILKFNSWRLKRLQQKIYEKHRIHQEKQKIEDEQKYIMIKVRRRDIEENTSEGDKNGKIYCSCLFEDEE